MLTTTPPSATTLAQNVALLPWIFLLQRNPYPKASGGLINAYANGKSSTRNCVPLWSKWRARSVNSLPRTLAKVRYDRELSSPTTMASSYKYQPLSSPSTQIRLLELLPGRGIIQCRLKVTDLGEAENTYEPISYCWKAYTRENWLGYTYKEKRKQNKVRLRVDGANVYITENLHGALRQMRLESKARVLWADAICINQEDDKEKSTQVAMMAQIYKGGSQTLVWLGEADRRTRKAFKFLKDCADLAVETTSLSSQTESSTPEMNPSDFNTPNVPTIFRWLPALRDHFRRERSRVSVESIVSRPYFRRTWVIQEIIKSKAVLYMCGKFVISFSDLMDGVSGMTGLVRGADSFNALDDIWGYLDDFDLMEVVMVASSTQASDPRDKLYGLIGLVPDEAMTTDITVDYNKDPREVFYDFTRGLLLASTKLSVLAMSYGCSPDKPINVPSWVWNPQPDEPYDRLSLPHSASKQYKAALDSQSKPEVCGDMLGVRGIVLQTVTTVTSGWEPLSSRYLPFHLGDPRELLHQLLSYFEYRAVGGISDVSTDHTTAENLRNILFRTTWPYRFSTETPLPAFNQLNEARYIEELTCFDSKVVKHFGKYACGEKKPITLWTRFKLLTVIETWMIRNAFGDPAARELEKLMPAYSYLGNRRLVRTDGGDIALCPKETAVKDKLVLLQGSDVPFILRPIGIRWQIVGECYVHVLMDGSAWDESRCEMLWIE